MVIMDNGAETQKSRRACARAHTEQRTSGERVPDREKKTEKCEWQLFQTEAYANAQNIDAPPPQRQKRRKYVLRV